MAREERRREGRRWPIRVAVYGSLLLALGAGATYPFLRTESPLPNAPSVVFRTHRSLTSYSCSLASARDGREVSASIPCDAFAWAYAGQSVPAVAVNERGSGHACVFDSGGGAIVHCHDGVVHAMGFDDRLFVAEAASADQPVPQPDAYRYLEIARDGDQRDASCFYQLDAFTCLTPDGRLFSAYWWDLETPTAGPPNDVPAFDRLERVTGCDPRLLAIVHRPSGGSRMLAFDHDGVLRWSRDVSDPDHVSVDAFCGELGQIGVLEGDTMRTLDLATGAEATPPTLEEMEARRTRR